jgi:aspartyl-tRNA(Asn)/glutamyl-tRNA(Gln) amidotransferase subunit A
MDVQLLNMTLVQIGNAIRQKTISSLEVVRNAIERAEQIQPTVNCFINLEPESAIKAARAADRALGRKEKLGPLHGVPLAHKDLYYRKGRISTFGSKICRDYRPSFTATVVERIQTAGAIWLGNLNMAEFASGPTGHNDHWGHCRNPWNTAHITGGSSSGSGVAVAARACYGSLGTDTGGSIRLPAAACGVVGLKPTYGRVSRYGTMARSWSLDCIGPLTRTVRDCARMMRVIAGVDPMDANCSQEPVPNYERELTGKIRGVRIGVPQNYFYENASDNVRQIMAESLEVLKQLGARVIELDVPDTQRLYLLGATVSQCEAAAIHARWMRTRKDDYALGVSSRMEAGYHIPAVSYLEALTARGPLAADFIRTVFSKVDALHTPVMNMSVPTIAETEIRASGEAPDLVARIIRNTRPINYLGFPALAVPGGFSADGLPLSFQLVGRPFSESLLLRIGDTYQRETEWHERAPQL